VSASRSASVTITLADTVAPVVTAFTLPATAASLTVTISSFTATDAVGVAAYLLTETATQPLAADTGWLSVKPTSYTFATAGAHTLYAWAKDTAGNVSASRSASVTITIPDTVAPVVTAFTLPASSASLTVTISLFIATDAVGVTAYLLAETATQPLAADARWVSVKPTNYTFATAGAHTLYAWAKDAAGNVSAGSSATVTIALPPPPAVMTLTVASAPSTGVLVTVTPADNSGSGDGSTQFTRAYNQGVQVTLTAAASAGGVNFSGWSGCTSAAGMTCLVTMDSSLTVTANYSAQTAHVLWSRGDTGQATLWNVAPGLGMNGVIPITSWKFVGSSTGVGSGWEAKSYQEVSPTEGYVLWSRRESGQATLWKVNPSTGTASLQVTGWQFVGSSAGVGGPWDATSYQHVSATEGYVLWTRSDTGQATLWQVDPSTGTTNATVTGWHFLGSADGVGGPWEATAYQHVSNTEGYILWTRSDTGRAALWKINPGLFSTVIPVTANLYSSQSLGAPWRATGYQHVSATEGYVLWTRSDTGQAVVWRINPNSGASFGAPIPVADTACVYSAAGIGGSWHAAGYSLSGASAAPAADPAPAAATAAQPGLQVLKSGSGTGTVEAGGVVCGPTCAEVAVPYAARAAVVVTAAAGSWFAGWETVDGLAIDLNQAQPGESVRAVFKLY
jgi:hypothetical protein